MAFKSEGVKKKSISKFSELEVINYSWFYSRVHFNILNSRLQMMNKDNRIIELSTKIYGLLLNDKFHATIELLDGTKVSGRIVKHTTSSSPFNVTILIFTAENEEKEIDLSTIKSITEL